MSPTTKELEEELTRRRTKHNIRIGGTVIALNLDEMEDVLKQIQEHLEPKKVVRDPVDKLGEDWFKKLAEEAAKKGKQLPVYPPINVPNWPTHPNPGKWPNYPGEPVSPGWPQPDKVWCQTEGTSSKDEMGR